MRIASLTALSLSSYLFVAVEAIPTDSLCSRQLLLSVLLVAIKLDVGANDGNSRSAFFSVAIAYRRRLCLSLGQAEPNLLHPLIQSFVCSFIHSQADVFAWLLWCQEQSNLIDARSLTLLLLLFLDSRIEIRGSTLDGWSVRARNRQWQ